jgi:hypothetical protein
MARSPRLCPHSFMVCYSNWVSPRPRNTSSIVFPSQGAWSSPAQWRSSMGRRWSTSMLVPPLVRLVLRQWLTLLGRRWRASTTLGTVSYPVFMPKSSTHRMHDPGSIILHIRPKVFTDNQKSRIKYNYYISNVSKDWWLSTQQNKTEQQKIS